ncbi:hypothetical protein [Endozoicomonas sp. ONNA2]|uniref:hypothetical protein n=1 Tax=Endozoicomonas sp. ONNA2 TaxID=2828741 RepID=UPI0021486FBA|nr:hypothetical protein [Endozoicomonas sp. ONNA2]
MTPTLNESLQTSISRHLEAYNSTKEIKQRISRCFGRFSIVKTFELTGDDNKLRPVGVGMQTIIEQAIHELIINRSLEEVVAVIHTKTPATPLVSPENTAPPEAMSTQMQGDIAREKTIIDRTVTVRNLAKCDPEIMTLYIAYPKSGLQNRTSDQQEIYLNELGKKENKCLKDLPLSHETMPDDLVGASYILTGADAGDESEQLYFGLRAVQAKDAGEEKTKTWTFWLGELNNAEIQPRYIEVKTYLDKGTDVNISF